MFLYSMIFLLSSIIGQFRYFKILTWCRGLVGLEFQHIEFGLLSKHILFRKNYQFPRILKQNFVLTFPWISSSNQIGESKRCVLFSSLFNRVTKRKCDAQVRGRRPCIKDKFRHLRINRKT